MTELADSLAAFANLDLTESHARAAADLLRGRLDYGTPAERAAALVLITELKERAAPEPRGWFPGSSATPL